MITMTSTLPKADVPTFRFTDINPVTRRAYTASKYRDLPPWALHVVADAGYRPAHWNKLVTDGRVMEEPAFRGIYALPVTMADVESLRPAELAMALAASGVDLPRKCSREQTFAWAALGVARLGVDGIRAANVKARELRLDGNFGAASKMYGGVRREDRAVALATFATVLYGMKVTA